MQFLLPLWIYFTVRDFSTVEVNTECFIVVRMQVNNTINIGSSVENLKIFRQFWTKMVEKFLMTQNNPLISFFFQQKR